MPEPLDPSYAILDATEQAVERDTTVLDGAADVFMSSVTAWAKLEADAARLDDLTLLSIAMQALKGRALRLDVSPNNVLNASAHAAAGLVLGYPKGERRKAYDAFGQTMAFYMAKNEGKF